LFPYVANALQDVQFFREASDVQFDETGNRKRKHRYGDEDEIEMEQQERKRRQGLNKEFNLFGEKLAEAASNSVIRSEYIRFTCLSC
jgi:nucleosome binding factor SPN SPT16 subunit